MRKAMLAAATVVALLLPSAAAGNHTPCRDSAYEYGVCDHWPDGSRSDDTGLYVEAFTASMPTGWSNDLTWAIQNHINQTGNFFRLVRVDYNLACPLPGGGSYNRASFCVANYFASGTYCGINDPSVWVGCAESYIWWEWINGEWQTKSHFAKCEVRINSGNPHLTLGNQVEQRFVMGHELGHCTSGDHTPDTHPSGNTMMHWTLYANCPGCNANWYDSGSLGTFINSNWHNDPGPGNGTTWCCNGGNPVVISDSGRDDGKGKPSKQELKERYGVPDFVADLRWGGWAGGKPVFVADESQVRKIGNSNGKWHLVTPPEAVALGSTDVLTFGRPPERDDGFNPAWLLLILPVAILVALAVSRRRTA